MRNIFETGTSEEMIKRLEQLTPASAPQWGKMNVSQMLAHCNVTYEMAYETIHPKPGSFKRWLLTLFVKKIVVNEVPYKRNSRTAPEFLISDARDFEKEKSRLVAYIRQTAAHGKAYFDGKESHSFGPLTASEWNNLFYKHLDHHLGQFGV